MKKSKQARIALAVLAAVSVLGSVSQIQAGNGGRVTHHWSDGTLVVDKNQATEGPLKGDTFKDQNIQDGSIFFNRLVFADARITDTDITGNTVTADGPAGGALYFSAYPDAARTTDPIKVSITGGSIEDNHIISTGTKPTTGSAANGGGLFLKGGEMTLTDVAINHNTATSTTGAMAMGGAIYADAKQSKLDGKDYDIASKVTFKISDGKNMAYTGNTVSGAEGTGDTYGALAVTSGGFLFLDRNSSAEFNIGTGSSLTIGTEGDTTRGHDDIASAIPKTADRTNNSFSKTGAGTLTIHSTLNDYHGDIDVKEGTMKVTSDWATANNVTISGGATLDVSNTALTVGGGKEVTYTTPDGQTATIVLPETHADLTVKSNGTLHAGDVTIDTNASLTAESNSTVTAGNVTIGAGATPANHVSQLAAEKGASFTIGAGADVTMKNLTVNGGGTVTAGTDANVTMENLQVEANGTMNAASGSEVTVENNAVILGALKTAVDSLFTANKVTFESGADVSIQGEADIKGITNNTGEDLINMIGTNATTDSTLVLKKENSKVEIAADAAGGLSFKSGVTTGDSIKYTETANLDASGNFKANGQITAADGFTTENGQFNVDKEGNLNIGNGQFKVDAATGNTIVGGNLDVNGTLTVGGKELATGDQVQGVQTQVSTNKENIAANKKVIGDGKLANGAADLTAGVNQNTAAIQQNSDAISGLGRSVNKLGDEVDSVGAISAALAGLHPLDYNAASKFQVAAAIGTYDGTQAGAIGAFYHFNRDVMVSLGGSTSFKGERKSAANVGVTFRVGQGGSEETGVFSQDLMKRLEAMDAKITELNAKVQDLEQENQSLKNAQKEEQK